MRQRVLDAGTSLFRAILSSDLSVTDYTFSEFARVVIDEVDHELGQMEEFITSYRVASLDLQSTISETRCAPVAQPSPLCVMCRRIRGTQSVTNVSSFASFEEPT